MTGFQCDGPVNVEIGVPTGRVDVTAEERNSVEVDVTPADNSEASRSMAEETVVEFSDGLLVVQVPEDVRRRSPGAIKVEAKVPSESSLVIGVANADATCTGTFGDVKVSSASGAISVGDALRDARIHTASGNARLGDVDGDLTVRTASGDIEAGVVGGSLSVKSASGDIKLVSLGGNLNAETASGDLKIGSLSKGEVSARTVSGKVRLGVRIGTGVWLDLSSMSGSIDSDLESSDDSPGGHDLSIQVRTVSGSIKIERAKEAAAV